MILSSEINGILFKKYGKQKQFIVAMEELAELIQACSKYLRYGNNIQNFISEIIDSKIMIDQIEHYVKSKNILYDLLYTQELKIKKERVMRLINK